MELFKAKLGSPVTQLAENITNTQTTISLVNADVLPDAPNIATIGTGVNAETVRYAGKTLNTLTGVTRGFTGTAKAWTSGQSIARIFTQYDHDSLVESVGDVASEEGTWTPTLATTGGLFEGVTYNPATFGRYVKIGKAVHIRCHIKTDAVILGVATGYVAIAGFPFPADSNLSPMSVAASKDWNTNNPTGLYKMPINATALLFYKAAANDNSTQLPYSSVATGANANEILFSGTYYTS